MPILPSMASSRYTILSAHQVFDRMFKRDGNCSPLTFLFLFYITIENILNNFHCYCGIPGMRLKGHKQAWKASDIREISTVDLEVCALTLTKSQLICCLIDISLRHFY